MCSSNNIFDRPVNRRGTNSMKHDTMPYADTIPLWVADMDFETAPCVLSALRQRLQHGCFGYTHVPDSYYRATIDWFANRHHWHGIQQEWFIYTSGVVPAISAIIKAMTTPGDKVLVQTPVYNCFFSSIRNNGCQIAEAPLSYATSEQGNGNDVYHRSHYYFIDYEAFEQACADPDVKVFILCNPHNPAGRVWSSEELRRMGEICKRHGVFVIADEIHCEFVNPRAKRDGYLAAYLHEEQIQYHPFMSISDAPCAVCVSPSKGFNIAGLQIANIIVPDAAIRQRIDKAININEVCDVNPFGVIALQAAYTDEGAQWIRSLCNYIYANYDFAKAYIEEHLPSWHVTTLEGTYLMWVDISQTGLTGEQMEQLLLDCAHVYVNAGNHYGTAAGNHFIRINLATQRANLHTALERICAIYNK